MKAGFSKSEILFPEEMFPLEGFKGIHDNPHVRMMYLEGVCDVMVLCVLELVNVPRKGIDYCRRRVSKELNVEDKKVWVHMTHAITTPHEPGPMGPPNHRPPITDEDLKKKELFYGAIEKAIDAASVALRLDINEVSLSWGDALCMANQNRDVKTPFGWWIGQNGKGPSNHNMQVLRATTAEGNLKGVFVSFGIKPCAIDNSGMMQGERLVSSECCGKACLLAEEVLDVPVIFAMSAAGDQIPIYTSLHEDVTDDGLVKYRDEGVEQGFLYADKVGDIMSQSIVEAVSLANESVNDETGWEMLSFTWQRKQSEPRKVTNQMECIADGETEFMAEVFRLGNAFFIAERPEINTQTEYELLEKCPLDRVILLSMTNGEMKYLPDQKAFENSTWEAQSAMFMPGAAERFVEEAGNAMNRLI